jgi:hypothetical protein
MIKFETELQIDRSKPIRICIGAHPTIFPRLSLEPVPSRGIIRHGEWNLAGVELARQVYSHLFEPITTEAIRLLIQEQGAVLKEKAAAPLISDMDSEKWMDFSVLDNEEWDYYSITFDYRVLKDDIDPEAVMLRVDDELQVTRSRSSKDRVRINSQVTMGREIQRGMH